MWSKWASASSSVQQLGASNCFLNLLQICISFAFWVRLICWKQNMSSACYFLGHPTHSSKHQTLPYTWAVLFLSDKKQLWFGNLRVVDIELIHSAQCFAVVLLWTISLIAFPRMRSVLMSWKCFSMNLSVYSTHSSSSEYNHVLVDDFQNQIWSQICGQPSIFIFIYTYDYICILYTNRSNV